MARVKPTTTWTDRTPPSTSWTDRTPPSTSWTNRNKPSTSWDTRIGYLLCEDGTYLLQENGFKIVVSSAGGMPIWSLRSQPVTNWS